MNAMKLHNVIETLDATGADFAGSTFENVTFAGSGFKNVSFAGASFDDVNMAGWRVANADLSGLHLSNANLAGASFRQCRLSGARIDGILIDHMIAAYNALAKGNAEDAIAALKTLKQEQK